jgi:Secretion system C-terminal sorting domain
LGSGTSILTTDNRTGKITLNIPIPAGITQDQIKVSLDTRKFMASSVVNGKAVFVLDRLYSFQSAQTILVEFGTCKFSFQVVVPKREAEYFEDKVQRFNKGLDAYDPVKNLCNFNATCSKEDNPLKDLVNPSFPVSFPPIKFISRSQTFDRSVSKRKCEKVAVCGASNFSYEARLHQLPFEERLVDAITTYAGIFNEVLNSIITDPKIKLTPAEKEFMIEKLCADNKDRQRCRKVRFCPGSFEVIDDSAPGGPLFGRRKNSDQLSEDGKCWELDCGRGRGREMLSTCDPELAQVVKIIAPVGPTGGVCLDVEDRDDTSNNTDGENGKKCEKYEYTRTTAAQLLAASSPDELSIIPGSQLERIFLLLKNRAYALDQLLGKVGVGASRLACFKIKYCSITQVVRNFGSLERDIINEDCQTCSNANMVFTSLYDLVRRLPNNPISADFRYLKQAYGFDPASTPITYRCVPIEYCPGTDVVKRIDRVSDLVRQVTTFDCPNCTVISVRFNVLVGIYFRKDMKEWRKLIGENEQYEDFILEGEDLEKLILKNGRYHSSTYEGCPIIQFCKENNKVFNLRKIDEYLFNSTCNHLFHEGGQNNHTISFGSNLFSQQNELEPRSPKYFEDFPANEVFNMFTPQISGGFFSGKAAISNEKTGKYYNFSHDVKPLQVLKDSAIVFKYDNWDTDQYWYIDRMNSNREYWISHDEEAGYWGAPIESDSLLQFSKIEVQDSVAYLSGIFTGALRFRGQLLSSDFPHDRISAFVLALRSNGTVKGVHIFQGIDTLYGGFSFALGNGGKIYVSGQKATQHSLKHNGADLNLLGRSTFFGAIEPNTQFFQLIQAPDLGSGRILTMAVSPEGDDIGLLIGPSSAITWSNNALKADPGTGLNVVSIDQLGALNWSQHISGALDLRQRDLKYGYQKRIIFAYTYQGAVNVADSLTVSSNGKEDIGLIQFSNTGGIRWHKNYGTPETETVKALLYNYGVVYFGGDFKGNQSVRSVGEYDFHNTTQYPNRAYVSYVLDSLSIQDTTGVTYEIAAYQAPKFASHISNKNTLKAYPNPFQNQITAEFILDTPGEITLQLFNQLGNVVEVRKINANDGLNREQISTNSLPSGLYFLHLHDAQNRQIGVQKVLKM